MSEIRHGIAAWLSEFEAANKQQQSDLRSHHDKLAERIEAALRATAATSTEGTLSAIRDYLLRYGELDATFAGSRAAVNTYSDAMHAGLSALRGEKDD